MLIKGDQDLLTKLKPENVDLWGATQDWKFNALPILGHIKWLSTLALSNPKFAFEEMQTQLEILGRNLDRYPHEILQEMISTSHHPQGDISECEEWTRNQEIIADNLRAARLTVLSGPGGVRQSLLLQRAIRNLRRQAEQNWEIYGTPEFVPVLFCDWQGDPVQGLKAKVKEAISKTFPDVTWEPVSVSLPLKDWLCAWMSRIDSIDLLIVLDQFENFFWHHQDKSSPGSFADEFPRIFTASDVQVHFLISIRDEELAKLFFFKGKLPGMMDNWLRIA